MACVTLYEKRLADNKCHVTCQSLEDHQGNESDESYSCHVQYLFCPASLRKSREESESLLDKLPGWLVPKIVLKTPFKVLILILFAGYLGASVYGIINMQEGLEFKQTVNDDSYFHKFAVLNEAFSQEFPIMFVVERPYDYFNTTVRARINEVVNQAVLSASMQNSSMLSWLSTYINSPFFNTISSEEFIPNLKDKFLTQPLYEIFQNDIVLDKQNRSITCSRFYILSQSISSSVEQGDFMLRIREIASLSSVSMIAFTPFFIVFEQYVSIVSQTVQTVSIAVACVFIVTAFLIPHPVILIYITGTVIMIMAGVFGFLYFVDLALNSITMTILIMAVGFSVDFTVHMSHGYLTADGLTRHEKVMKAIKMSGAPIFHGAMTSMIGIVVLLFLKSYTLRAFGKVIMIVMALGIVHALFFLPVLLSLIGPSARYRSRDTSSPSDKTRSDPKRWRCYFRNKVSCSKPTLPREAPLQIIIEPKEEREKY
ncbi:hypothetical protein CHS0354_040365 [Potamilus streckersoni]|uniref:SSD domain-containing protein n=1 Tax=Potamilus streckersoni TaxID=2493646 RepID=A0AAE0S1I7_9BIVA|nr:hypothetical protein CHS0354_040365 [Potamilus streckersoni]